MYANAIHFSARSTCRSIARGPAGCERTDLDALEHGVFRESLEVSDPGFLHRPDRLAADDAPVVHLLLREAKLVCFGRFAVRRDQRQEGEASGPNVAFHRARASRAKSRSSGCRLPVPMVQLTSPKERPCPSKLPLRP